MIANAIITIAFVAASQYSLLHGWTASAVVYTIVAILFAFATTRLAKR